MKVNTYKVVLVTPDGAHSNSIFNKLVEDPDCFPFGLDYEPVDEETKQVEFPDPFNAERDGEVFIISEDDDRLVRWQNRATEEINKILRPVLGG